MYLLLTLILCVPLLNWVLYIFFWLLSPLIISADLGPMRSPSDLGPMDLLLTLILCVHLLTWDMCIFFWRWSYAFLFWPEFYVSSSDFVLMRSFSDLGPMNLLLTLILYVPLLTCVLCIFFWTHRINVRRRSIGPRSEEERIGPRSAEIIRGDKSQKKIYKTQFRRGTHRINVRRRYIEPWSEEERIGSKSEEDT
jgi:hypothetical protein